MNQRNTRGYSCLPMGTTNRKRSVKLSYRYFTPRKLLDAGLIIHDGQGNCIITNSTVVHGSIISHGDDEPKCIQHPLTLSAHSPNPLIQTIIHPIPFHCSHCSNVHNTIVQGEQLSFWAAGKYKITGMIATRQRKQVTKPELKLKIVTDWQRKQLDSNTRNQQEAAWQG